MTTSESIHRVTDPADLGVLEASSLLRGRALSAVELTEACLAQIERRNGGAPTFDGAPDAVNAWVRLYPELALAAARAADERLAAGDAPALCGIPLGLKDLYAMEGLPLTASSRVLEGHVAGADAQVWARLGRQGMVALGHTHTHEFAAGGTTDQVGNPWALHRVVGGSSGGSAAALAAGMIPAALGSDTCGSLRIPSACCSTSAIKPTHGLLPLDGIVPLAPTLDHPGPMARTIADCAVLLTAMAAGGPPVNPTVPPPMALPELPLGPSGGSQPLEGLTIALTDRTEQTQLDAEVAAALDTARRACEQLGASVVSAPAPWHHDWDDLSCVLFTDVWAYHAQHAGRAELYRPSIAEFVEAAENFTNAAAYLAAQERRAAGTAAWERWFAEGGIDLVLGPTLPIVPSGRGPGYERGHPAGPGDPMIALTSIWDLTGMPVAALPVTWGAGISLVAPRGHEVELVAAAIDLQESALPAPRWPGATEHGNGDATIRPSHPTRSSDGREQT
jgi:aspartyl-tRNA(Asn)/glutamyl-tRNA(Gln) amidotransferase subunit A